MKDFTTAEPVSTPMRIFFANSTRTWGGVRSWTIRLIRELSLNGDSCFLAARPKTDFLAKAEAAGAKIIPFPFGADYSPWQIWKAYRVLKRTKPDVVVTNISKELRSFGIAAKLLKIPVISRLGLSTDVTPKLRSRLDYRFLVKSFLVPSYSMKRELPRSIIENKTIHVVHNGVVLPPPSNKQPSSTVRILHLGKISSRKGANYLCSAVAQLVQEHLPVHLTLAGEGELLASLKKSYSHISQIEFTGHISHPASLLEEAHIGVLHSAQEGFPNTLLEYMAHGLAPVSTPVDGIPELIVDSSCGVLTPFGNTEQLTSALRQLVLYPERIHAIGQQARQRIEKEFQMVHQAQKIRAIFHQESSR